MIRVPRLKAFDFLPDPSHNDQLLVFEPDEEEFAMTTSSPPCSSRPCIPPMLVPAVSRASSTALVPSRSQSVASRGTLVVPSGPPMST
jgi:hypothetical protein